MEFEGRRWLTDKRSLLCCFQGTGGYAEGWETASYPAKLMDLRGITMMTERYEDGMRIISVDTEKFVEALDQRPTTGLRSRPRKKSGRPSGSSRQRSSASSPTTWGFPPRPTKEAAGTDAARPTSDKIHICQPGKTRDTIGHTGPRENAVWPANLFKTRGV